MLFVFFGVVCCMVLLCVCSVFVVFEMESVFVVVRVEYFFREWLVINLMWLVVLNFFLDLSIVIMVMLEVISVGWVFLVRVSFFLLLCYMRCDKFCLRVLLIFLNIFCVVGKVLVSVFFILIFCEFCFGKVNVNDIVFFFYLFNEWVKFIDGVKRYVVGFCVKSF